MSSRSWLALLTLLATARAGAAQTAPPTSAPDAVAATPAAIPAASTEPPPTATTAPAESLDQRVRILERKLELADEQAAEKAKSAVAVKADKEGFGLKSANGDFQLKLRGYAQLDGRFFLGDDRKPQTDTYLLRRVRPILEGTLYKIFDFRIMPDFGGGQAVLYDAYLEARFSPALRLRAGKFKPPVGIERLQSATDLTFAERALPTNLVPNRDLGIQLGGDLVGGKLGYALGLFNGTVDLGNGDGDSNDAKDVEGRLFWRPFQPAESSPPGIDLGLGVGASIGRHRGTATAPGLPSYRAPSQASFFAYRSDGTAAGTAIADGRQTRFSPQGWLYAGSWGVLVEGVRSTQRVARGTTHVALDHDAWQVTAAWVVTGERLSYRGVVPRHDFAPGTGGWGALVLAARASSLALDARTFPTFANPASAARRASAWAAGLCWYLNRSVRVLLDYESTRFDGGDVSRDRETEKVLFSRFQVSF